MHYLVRLTLPKALFLHSKASSLHLEAPNLEIRTAFLEVGTAFLQNQAASLEVEPLLVKGIAAKSHVKGAPLKKIGAFIEQDGRVVALQRCFFAKRSSRRETASYGFGVRFVQEPDLKGL